MFESTDFGDCCEELNYVGSKNMQSYLGSNEVKIFYIIILFANARAPINAIWIVFQVV